MKRMFLISFIVLLLALQAPPSGMSLLYPLCSCRTTCGTP